MTFLYPAETNSGVVTSWVPLTTVYTPTAPCSTQFRLNGPSLVAFDPGYGLDIDSRIICAPPAVTTWWEQGRLGSGNNAGHTAASLGPMTCPSDWQTVATSVKDVSSTIAMCCPSGYFLVNGIANSIAGDCRSNVASGMVLTYASTPIDESTLWTTTTTTLSTASEVGAIAVVGWNIQATSTSSSISSTISSNTPSSIFTSASIFSSTSQTAFSGSSSRTTGAFGASTTSPESSTGISTGTAIGVGVGVGLGGIGIISLLCALFMTRRSRSKAQRVTLPPASINTAPTSQAGGHWNAVKHELAGSNVMAELPGYGI